MRKKIDVLFYMEHKNREEETIKTIISELDGYSTRIASSLFSMGLSKLFYKPKLIITPWMYEDKDYKILTSFPFLKKLKILNLHHEQITNEDRIKALLPSNFAKEGFHISWGKYFTKKLEEEKIEKDNIFETGSIRLSLSKKISYSRKDLKNMFLSDINVENEWRIFVSSFSWKNLSDEQLKKIEKKGRKNVFEYRRLVRDSYLETLNWISIFLEKNKDIEYLYRLHPSEAKDEKLEELEKKYKNFYVIKELSINEWINNCDEIELWISTSIAEIINLKKPFRIIRPFYLNHNVEVFGFENFKKIENMNEYLNEKNGIANLKNGEKYLGKFYNVSNPIGKTIVAIKKILKEKKSETIKLNEIEKLLICFREVLKDVLKIIAVKLKMNCFLKINKISKDYFIFTKRL